MKKVERVPALQKVDVQKILNLTGLVFGIVMLICFLLGDKSASGFLNAGFPVILACWLFLFTGLLCLVEAAWSIFMLIKGKRDLIIILQILFCLCILTVVLVMFQKVWLYQKILNGNWDLSEAAYKAVKTLDIVPISGYWVSVLLIAKYFLTRKDKHGKQKKH